MAREIKVSGTVLTAIGIGLKQFFPKGSKTLPVTFYGTDGNLLCNVVEHNIYTAVFGPSDYDSYITVNYYDWLPFIDMKDTYTLRIDNTVTIYSAKLTISYPMSYEQRKPMEIDPPSLSTFDPIDAAQLRELLQAKALLGKFRKEYNLIIKDGSAYMVTPTIWFKFCNVKFKEEMAISLTNLQLILSMNPEQYCVVDRQLQVFSRLNKCTVPISPVTFNPSEFESMRTKVLFESKLYTEGLYQIIAGIDSMGCTSVMLGLGETVSVTASGVGVSIRSTDDVASHIVTMPCQTLLIILKSMRKETSLDVKLYEGGILCLTSKSIDIVTRVS